MKLNLTTGCICDSLTVDGVEEVDMTESLRTETKVKLLTWLAEHPEKLDLNQMLQQILPEYGEYDSSGEPCECCGDYVNEWNLEI